MVKYSKIGNEVLPWYRIPTDYLNRLTADDFCDKYFAGASAFLLLKTGRREENNMLLSLALIFLCGLALGGIFRKLHLPQLLGMLLTGILLGPYVLNLLDSSILGISADLRQIALIIILTRAGLNLDLEDLKKVGRPAALLCFVPAAFEIAGMLLLAPRLLGISLLEAAVMGTVVAAVSPAVVVPGMLKLMEEGYGTKKSIPQMIMAGASVDDVFVIVLFTSFTGLAGGGGISAWDFVRIPVSILLGLAGGDSLRHTACRLFQKSPYERQRQGNHYSEPILPACDIGACIDRHCGILRPACRNEYGNSITERKKGSSGEAVRQIFQTVGGGRTSPVCPGRSGSGYPLCIQSGSCCSGRDPGSVSIPYAGSPDLPAGNGTEQEGEAVLYVCLHA